MTLESYENCGDHQVPRVWNDRCKKCRHLLAVHRDYDGILVCDMCALAADTVLALKEHVADMIRRNGGHV